MTKKILYSGFNDERTFIVDYCQKKYDWEPVFFLAEEKTRKWASEKYPSAFFQEATQLRKAQYNYSSIGDSVPIDATIIEALSKYILSC